MAATMNVNDQTVVHKTSEGVTTTFPDACKTKVGKPIVPVPYTNASFSTSTSKGSKTVFVDSNAIMLKGSQFSTSTGDEAGSYGGVASGCNKGKAEFINYSFNVFVESKNVPRRMDLMLQNKGSAFNTPPAPLIQPGFTIEPFIEEVPSICYQCLLSALQAGTPFAKLSV